MDLIYSALSAIANVIINGIAYIIDVLAMAITSEFLPAMWGGSLWEWSNMGVSDKMNQIFPFMRPANHIFVYIAISMVSIIFVFNVLRSFKPGLDHNEGIFTHIYRAVLAMILVGLSYSLINAAMWLGYEMIDYTKNWDYYDYSAEHMDDSPLTDVAGNVIDVDKDGNPKITLIGKDEEEIVWEELSEEEQNEILDEVSKKDPALSDRMRNRTMDYDDMIRFSKLMSGAYYKTHGGVLIDTDHVGTGIADSIDTALSMDDAWSGGTGLVLGKTIIVPVLLMIAILWNFCKLFMEMAERLIVTTFVTSLAPLGFCSVVSKETEGIFYKYLQMVFSTYLVFIIDIWFLRTFIYSVGNTAVALDMTNFIWNMFLWLALLITAQKADQHLREAGLSVSQTGGNLLGEMMLSGRLLGSAARNGTLGNGIAGTRFGKMIGARTVASPTRSTGAKAVGNQLKHFMGNDAANNLMNSGLLTPTNDSHFLDPKIQNGKVTGFTATMAGKSGNAVQVESVGSAQEALDKGMTPFAYAGQTYGLSGDRDDVAAITGAFGGGEAPVVDDSTLKSFDTGFDDPVGELSESADVVAAAEADRQFDDDLINSLNSASGNARAESSVDMAEAKRKEAAAFENDSYAMEGGAYTRAAISDKVDAVNEAGTAGMSADQREQSISGASNFISSSGLDGDYVGCFNYAKAEDPAYMTRTKALESDTGKGVEFQTVPSEYTSAHPEMFEGRTPVKTWTDSNGKQYSTYKSSALSTKESVTLTDMAGETAFKGQLNKTSARGIYTYRTPDQYERNDSGKPRKVKSGQTKCVLDPDFVTIPKSAQRVELAGGKALFICDVEKAGDQRKRC